MSRTLFYPHPNPLGNCSQRDSTSCIHAVVPKGEGAKSRGPRVSSECPLSLWERARVREAGLNLMTLRWVGGNVIKLRIFAPWRSPDEVKRNPGFQSKPPGFGCAPSGLLKSI